VRYNFITDRSWSGSWSVIKHRGTGCGHCYC